MRFFKILIVGMFFGTLAYADSSGMSALFTAATIGGAVNVGNQSIYGRLPYELSDWLDPESQSTARLKAQCGVLTEMKLVRTSRVNLLFVGIRNESGKDVALRLDRATAKFGNGRERFMVAHHGKSTLEVNKGWYSWGFLPFPQKSDFKGQETLSMSIPAVIDGVQGCELVESFARTPGVPEDENSYIEAPNFLIAMGIGSVLGRSGSMGSLFSEEFPLGADFYFGGFSRPSRGYYLQMSAYSMGKVKNSRLFGNVEYDNANMLDISLGPTWRSFYSENTTGYFNVGPSYASLSIFEPEPNKPDKTERGSIGLYSSYTYDWRYFRQQFGPLRGDYSFGLTVYVKYYPWLLPGASRDVGMIGLSFDLLRVGE